MAKRTRVRTRTRAGTKPAARNKPVTAKKERAPVKLDGRCLSRRIEFTPRLTAHIRQRYEEAGDSPEVIARSVGVAKGTIQRLVREQGWTPAEQGPRDLSRAEQLAAEAKALAASSGEAPLVPTPSPSPQGGGVQRAAPPEQDGAPEQEAVDIDQQIERLLRLVSAEIGVYETMRGQLKGEPQGQREALKTAHNLGSLTSTLDTLRRMRAGQTVMASHDDTDDDIPTDIDELREALARRIEAFMASRPDDGDAAGNEPARTDGA